MEKEPKYIPSLDEFKKGEEMMTSVQKKMSKQREERGRWAVLYDDKTPEQMREEIFGLEYSIKKYNERIDYYSNDEKNYTNLKEKAAAQGDTMRLINERANLIDKVIFLKKEIEELENTN